MTAKKQAAESKATPGLVQDVEHAAVVQTVEQKVKPLQQFLTKWNNDWTMTFATGLAYNLMMSLFPIVLAAVAILGFILNGLSPAAYRTVVNQAIHALPSATGASSLLAGAMNQVRTDAGILGVIAVVLALFSGSRLFIYIAGVFDIIYHVGTRSLLRQNAMALAMLLLFILLVPIMVVTASLPTFALSLVQQTPLVNIPDIGLLFTLGGIVGGVGAAFCLFWTIYMVVPNLPIKWGRSWLGALVAAVLLQLYLILFPLYVSHFVSGYQAAISLFLLLVFFYYFGVILFLGAEVNAFFMEKITATPQNVAELVHQVTSHLQTTSKALHKQAPPSHKDVTPKVIQPKGQQGSRRATRENKTTFPSAAVPNHPASPQQTSMTLKPPHPKAQPPLVPAILEALAGTALAFLVEYWRLRRRK